MSFPNGCKNASGEAGLEEAAEALEAGNFENEDMPECFEKRTPQKIDNARKPKLNVRQV